MGETFFGREVALSFLNEHFPNNQGVHVGHSTIDFHAYGDEQQLLRVVRYVPVRGKFGASIDTIVAPARRLRFHDRHPNIGLGWNPYNSIQTSSTLEMAGIALATWLEVPANPLTTQIHDLALSSLHRIHSDSESAIVTLQAQAFDRGVRDASVGNILR